MKNRSIFKGMSLTATLVSNTQLDWVTWAKDEEICSAPIHTYQISYIHIKHDVGFKVKTRMKETENEMYLTGICVKK